MKKIYFIILAFAAFIFNSCEKSLDIPQQGVTSTENFYKTDNDAEEAIAAVYVSWKSAIFNDFFLRNMLSDDIICGGGGRGDNTQLEQLNEYTFGTTNTFISGAFGSYYNIIYLSNLVINNFSTDSEVKKRVIAEAKVARAWSYFNLVTLWGPVPFVVKELAPSEYQQKNGDRAAIWAQIETDLQDAVNSNVLPQKSSPLDKSTGAHLTHQAALSFLGKTQIFREEYAEAAATLKQVINSGKYELFADYENLLVPESDFNKESIFELNSINDPNNTNQGTGVIANMFGWRNDHMNLWANTKGLAAYLGWGFFNPQKSLYDAFVATEGVDGYRLTSGMKTYPQIMSFNCFLNQGSNLYGHQGYFTWKYRLRSSDWVGSNVVGTHYNFKLMRYAEVLLLAAEASIKSGDETSARDYVNQVRTRAQIPTFTSAITMDNIKNEKRLELWMEQVRYQDIVRWGDAPDLLAGQGKDIPSFYGLKEGGTNDVRTTYTNSAYGFKTGKHELLPMPQSEMNVNQNLVQNPGW